MNEYRFRLYFVYLIDLHNLKFNGQLNSSHPRIAAPTCKMVNNDLVDALKDMTLNTDKENDITQEASKNQISCDFCGKSLSSKSGLTRHINSVHQDGKKQQKNCENCGKTLLSKSGMTRHINVAHNNEKKEVTKVIPANADFKYQVLSIINTCV